MFDAKKIERYYDYILTQVYDEGESPFHKNLTKQVVDGFVLPLNLPKEAVILDVGCGPGYFLDEMVAAGYHNLLGTTYSDGDIALCASKGHSVLPMDISFLSHADKSVDLLFSRHSLEHSPFPYITLLEYNRVLKDGAVMYVEVPAPDCPRQHEYNVNHYSILGVRQWHALFQRSGFTVKEYKDLSVNLTNTATDEKFSETYYAFVLIKDQTIEC